jgi:hypothetical protein
MTADRRRLFLGALVCALGLPAAPAGAAGPPLPSSASGKAGVLAPGGKERLITRRAGDDTLVLAVGRPRGEVLRARRISGRWRVAPVAFDGAATGLSADGRVLALARPMRRIPPAATGFAVLDARELVVRRELSLPGFFTMDAISPDGRWLYVIQYGRGENFLDYRVRALDTRTGRLAARDVVDPRNPKEQMGGLPITRAMSRDGRWAYTLYGGGEETFIHALDTVGRTAACIDLEMLPPQDDLTGYKLGVSPDGLRIRVRDPSGGLVATVNASTFAVSEPGEPAGARSEPAAAAGTRRTSSSPDDGGFPWLILMPAAALGGLCALGATIARRRPA